MEHREDWGGRHCHRGQYGAEKGLACRMTDYVINGPGSEPDRKVSLTWCKTKSGWKTS
jgi:hypothetical protein